MAGSEVIVYNGGAAAISDDDGCGGYRERMKGPTDVLAKAIVLAKGMIIKAGHKFLKKSKYGKEYEATLTAMRNLFFLVDKWSAEQTQTQGTCSTLARATWGYLGRIDCNARETRANSVATRINGAIGHVIRYIIDFFGSDWLTGVVADGMTSTFLITSMQDFISRIILNILCTIYTVGAGGTIATWRVIKIIITTTTQYAFEAGRMGLQAIGNMAVTIGGGLVQHFVGLPARLDNDADDVGEALLNRTDDFIEDNNLGEILQANDELEEAEAYDEGAALDDYEETEEAENLSTQADEAAKFMEQYVTWSLEQTEEGGIEYDEYQDLRRELLMISGRYDKNEEVQNQVVSQPLIYPSDDDETDDETDDEMDYEMQRANTFGGIIQKKDIPFIKNLKKSAQRMKNKYKLGKKHKKRTQKHKKRTQKHKKPEGRNMRARSRNAGYKYSNRKVSRRKNKRNKTKGRKFM